MRDVPEFSCMPADWLRSHNCFTNTSEAPRLRVLDDVELPLNSKTVIFLSFVFSVPFNTEIFICAPFSSSASCQEPVPLNTHSPNSILPADVMVFAEAEEAKTVRPLK